MKQLALNQFDLQKIKLSGKRGLEVFWYALGNNNDLLSVNSDAVVHQDLLDVLAKFRVVFATSQETLDGWNHSRDFIKGNDNALKNAVIGYDEEIERWEINKFEFKGSGENEGIALSGSRKVFSGRTKITSQIIKFNSECGVEDLQALAEELKEEVWQYAFKAKRANDLFAELPVDQRGIDSDVEEEQPQAEAPKVKKTVKTKVIPGLNVA